MAAIALTTAGRIEVIRSDPAQQRTLRASVAIAAGQVVRENTSGQWALANATDAANSTAPYLALKAVNAGEYLTASGVCTVDGLAITGMAYDAPIFLSDTAGTLSTTAGTVSVTLGRVKAATAVPVGTAPDKIAQFVMPL
jgi:hypothetical protein